MPDQRHDFAQRPSPDALLEAARREEGNVGKLRTFVGAAPGVGKTYEMLQQARAKRRNGADVVIGVVETHGRKETEALLEGLPMVPRRSVAYRGRTIEEMDLDAVTMIDESERLNRKVRPGGLHHPHSRPPRRGLGDKQK
jgi:two-component system sensor histidine kinase KdpD